MHYITAKFHHRYLYQISSNPFSLFADYISASPLLASCGISATNLTADLSQWKAKGEEIAKNLNFSFDFTSLEEFQKRRIYQYYLPVYFWCQKQLAAHRATGTKSPLVIGISAPQGCGKSTLCEQLEALFTSSGLIAASVSIDDFYLSYDGQQAVAQTYATNPLLQMRGNAGSHDLDLGAETLQALRAATSSKDAVKLPRYDKSAYQGKGDRAVPTTWPSVSGPVDIVLFEGWMLGFAPVEESEAASVDQNLVPVNAFLQAYKSAWDSAVDSWLVVKVNDPQYAYKWRLQAERAMRAAGKPAMSDEQVAQFVDRFMPAYKCYLAGLYKNGPTTAATGKVLVVEVDENREPISKQPQPIM